MRDRHPSTYRPSAQPRRPRPASARGLTLVEVTVMLSVIMILAGALMPVVTDSIGTARAVRARNDVAQIASALVNFQRDVGQVLADGRALSRASAAPLRSIDVLMSAGNVPRVAEAPVEAAGRPAGSGQAAMEAWVTSPAADWLDFHLRVNGRSYPTATSGPGTGWNGPYVGEEVPADPWGNRYLVNTGLLRENAGATGRCTSCAVFVLSAGPNGVVETPFSQPIANASVYGDDIAVRIQ
jgi:type II secretory pathway pseudopilin PulG